MTDEREITTVAAMVSSQMDIEGDFQDANATSRRIT